MTKSLFRYLLLKNKKAEYDCINMKMSQVLSFRDPIALLVGILSIVQDNTEGKREENIYELKECDDDMLTTIMCVTNHNGPDSYHDNPNDIYVLVH